MIGMQADGAGEGDAARAHARAAMVAHMAKHGICDARVLAAMAAVPRDPFIPAAHRGKVDPYGDHPCQIGFDQTMSQPFVVAYMLERLRVQPSEKVLEIGTGSGYQAALLHELGARVFTIERISALAEHARGVLAATGCDSVCVRVGDGYRGWPEEAPFAVIIVSCAPPILPAALAVQLCDGGRMIVPVGEGQQRLVVLRKRGACITEEQDLAVRFVPMVPAAEERHDGQA